MRRSSDQKIEDDETVPNADQIALLPGRPSAEPTEVRHKYLLGKRQAEASRSRTGEKAMAETEPKWYVKFTEKVSGPFAQEQLQKLAANGVLTPDHLVSSDCTEWQRASVLEGVTFQSADGMRTEAPSRKITATCECGKSFEVPASFAGTKRPCPACGRKCLIPSDRVADAMAEAIRSRPFLEAQRPTVFNVVTYAGLLTSAVAIVFSIAYPFLFVQLANMPVLSLLSIGGFVAVPALFKFLIFLELRAGKRWAWLAVQIFAVFEITPLLVLSAKLGLPWLVNLAIQATLYCSLLATLYTTSVQEYCSE
jgi:hypothetical protein